MPLRELFGVELPLIQAPMAGVHGSALTIAVSNAGGLGSLPCALLAPDAIRRELTAIRARTDKPYNVNFFCHPQPMPDASREAAWRATLAPYYREFGIDPQTIPEGPGRAAFNDEAAAIVAEFRPSVVSFHFGLPSSALLARVKISAPKSSHPQRPSTKRVGSSGKASTRSSHRDSKPAAIAECSCRTI
jgi:nitronate monooxygenase